MNQTPNQKFSNFLRRLIFKVFPILLVLNSFSQALDQFLIDRIQQELASETGTGWGLWIFGGASILNSLVTPLISLMLIFGVGFLQLKPAMAWTKFLELVKEQLRSMGSVLNWSLLLILPGLFRYLQLVFVPFVVLLNSKYNQGQIDALNEAQTLFKKSWKTVLLLFFIFGVCVPVTLSSFDEWRDFSQHLYTAIGFVALDVLIFVFLQWNLYRIWEKHYEPSVQ